MRPFGVLTVFSNGIISKWDNGLFLFVDPLKEGFFAQGEVIEVRSWRCFVIVGQREELREYLIPAPIVQILHQDTGCPFPAFIDPAGHALTAGNRGFL